MKINGKYYRIQEKVYKDGHKTYTAQVAINLYFFKIWTDFIYRSDKIRNWVMSGRTYEECKQNLLKYFDNKEQAHNKITIESTNYMYD